MDVVYPCCCGLDVHKASITACVLWAEGGGRTRKEKRRFGTFTRELLELADWLRACGVTHVAMEATGVYWKPVWNSRRPVYGGAARERAAHQGGPWSEDGSEGQ